MSKEHYLEDGYYVGILEKEIERLNKELDIAIDICNKRQVEIVRLNNIIDELEKFIDYQINCNEYNSIEEEYAYKNVLDKLQELKGSDKE